jgi:hypothetical protein
MWASSQKIKKLAGNINAEFLVAVRVGKRNCSAAFWHGAIPPGRMRDAIPNLSVHAIN